ncbi:CobQ/CobB/MinD/ParA nucleotide binding domain-containing protein (plasmid) [Cylindrospermum stagnale PCC 7417]|uniref:CobQ/CobB/MinD/ParA nucleotide binding domain-containing protein n=1 Tax=Cylindrospermum stagnale PCC 7417 TaxID=56107 RepID=K9X9G2_9NOST|nr:CobQ/CobB/MinD/ParA nucleotide binding domain-containing protein [Cylindrospermum stagnale]AFZ28302.1 CobQ/CobB/MinD/ParA nucleotide binding domain-containing protein [Cylindrospermum stagnale PCC 7417]
MKRIVMILGGKGGTGKTAFTRLLLDVLHTNNIHYLGYDADTENPELFEYYQNFGSGVQLLNFIEVAEAKRFFTEIKADSPDVVVVDMPGASGNKTREIINKFGLFKIAGDLGYRVSLVTVLNLGYSVITSLKAMLEFCGNQADYVVVKNLCWDKGLGFQRWDNSKTRVAISELNGIEIELPELEYSTFDMLIEKGLPFSAATEENGFPFGDYLLVSGFLDQAKPELEKAAVYLGLHQPVTNQAVVSQSLSASAADINKSTDNNKSAVSQSLSVDNGKSVVSQSSAADINKSAVSQSSSAEVNQAVSSTSRSASTANKSEVTETKARRGRKKPMNNNNKRNRGNSSNGNSNHNDIGISNSTNSNSSHSNNGNTNSSNNDIGNSDISTASSSLSLGASELGEVKTALGRLYKEFESFKLSQKAEREKDRAELQAWAQTNLIQNQLLSQAMATIELLTKELKNQGVSWNEFERSNADLKQELSRLLSPSQSTPKSSPTLESLELKGLKSEVSELKQGWKELVSHTNRLTTVIQEVKNQPPRTITIEKRFFALNL